MAVQPLDELEGAQKIGFRARWLGQRMSVEGDELLSRSLSQHQELEESRTTPSSFRKRYEHRVNQHYSGAPPSPSGTQSS